MIEQMSVEELFIYLSSRKGCENVALKLKDEEINGANVFTLSEDDMNAMGLKMGSKIALKKLLSDFGGIPPSNSSNSSNQASATSGKYFYR